MKLKTAFKNTNGEMSYKIYFPNLNSQLKNKSQNLYSLPFLKFEII